MDFVISRVAMAICALIVVMIFSGLLDVTTSPELEHELTSALEALDGLIDRAGSSRAEESIEWPVPQASGDGELAIELSCDLIRGAIGGCSKVMRPSCTIHTWGWLGAQMNRTSLEDRDRTSPPILASSGQTISIRSELMLIDNTPTFLVFVASES